MTLKEWEATVSKDITGDTLWGVTAYRLALYLSDLCWSDVSILLKDGRSRSIADQLYRAACSIGANVAEGYSRSTGRDRALFYQYALGSARESRDFYYKARFVLGEDTVAQRSTLLTEIIRLLLTMIPQQRGRVLREAQSSYTGTSDP